jgi:hypothetical protein
MKWKALLVLVPLGAFQLLVAATQYVQYIRHSPEQIDQLSSGNLAFIFMRMGVTFVVGAFILSTGVVLAFNIQQAGKLARLSGVLMLGSGVAFNAIGYLFSMTVQRNGFIGLLIGIALLTLFSAATYAVGSWLIRLNAEPPTQATV